jgi:membrane-associated protease RseP (regulator of RpoE activity)
MLARSTHSSGIVGIVAVGSTELETGWVNMLKFNVLLIVKLGLFTLLRIAPLDVGKNPCSLLEKVDPRPAGLHITLAVTGSCLLLFLMLYTTVLDVMWQIA